ncbi:MAG: hypothetical protein QNL04_13645 [SAR324 cluster bacterium]|nr:hypothetical protein [SAR324 cluster bacterium]
MAIRNSLFFLLLLVIYFFIQNFGQLKASSGDFGEHYTFVARIAENSSLPESFSPNLAGMRNYPKFSHSIAAFFSLPFDSPLVGIQITTLLAVVVIWASLAYLLFSIPQKFHLFFIVTFAILMVFARAKLGAFLLGNEITRYFFFPQAVGQAFVLLGILMVMAGEQKKIPKHFSYFFLGALSIFLCSFHLLPAVQILGFLFLLVCFDHINFAPEKLFKFDIPEWRSFALSFLVPLITLATFSVNPDVLFITAVAGKGGRVSMTYLRDSFGVGGLALVIFLLAIYYSKIWWTSQDQKKDLAFKYIGLLGLTIAILVIIQFTFLHLFHFGSEYSVGKYQYAVNSLFFLFLALFPAVFFKFRVEIDHKTLKYFKERLLPILFPALFVGFCMITWAPKPYRNNFAKYYRLEQFGQKVLKKNPAQEGRTILGLGVRGLNNFWLSLGVLRTTRGQSMSILLNRPINLNQVSFIVTSKRSPWDDGKCRTGVADGTTVVVDAECFRKNPKKPKRAKSTARKSKKSQTKKR